MTQTQLLDRFESNKLAMRILPRIGLEAGTCQDAQLFLESVLSTFNASLKAEYIAIVHGSRGRWKVVCDIGKQAPLPSELLATVFDEERGGESGQWVVAPTDPRSSNQTALAVHRKVGPFGEVTRENIEALAALVAFVTEPAVKGARRHARITRLEAILEIAAQWNQTLEMEALLTKMAETSTRLLHAERASIFLWDKANQTLVGRPALGVEGNALRIPDNVGVVGQVVQTGTTRRVDEDAREDQAQINRQVDEKLHFKTRSLLCVPLRSSSNEVFGAFEMINKIGGNFTTEDEEALVELAAHASVALENTQQREELIQAKEQIVAEAAQGVQMIGDCPAIKALTSTIARVAQTNLAVLILGENGTGKEVVAQLCHYLSERRNEPLVAVNCAAISETLLESELFGHEKGAFTDAHEARPGKFELASKGTLFLDEIGDMSLNGQAKLLRVLEEKVVVRVGGSRPIPTQARVFAATNQNLPDLVRAKRFREDLYYRLNVVTIELPPLRDRGEDVLLLAEHFLQTFSRKARRKIPKLMPAAKKRLLAHNWPGNIRELRNLMERLAYLTPEDKIDAEDLKFIMAPGQETPEGISLDSTLAEGTRLFQIEFIERQIKAARDNMTEAARRMGLHRSNLYRKMRQLGMEVNEEF